MATRRHHPHPGAAWPRRRLPGKPLADIAGEPMIVHVMARAAGGRHRPGGGGDRFRGDRGRRREGRRPRVMTAGRPCLRLRPHLRGARPSSIRSGACGIVVNVQGDLPTLDPADIARRARPAGRPGGRHRHARGRDPRAGGAHQPECGQGGRLAGRRRRRLRALYFTRATAPWARARSTTTSGSTPIAAPRSSASSRCRPRRSRQREKLEQLRALEAGMRIDVALVDSVPLGVDTPEDLEQRARACSRVDGGADRDELAMTQRKPERRKNDRLPGRAGRQLAHRLPRGLSGLRAAALPDLRGRLRGGRRRRGRARHDPDRELGRRPRRRHPSPDADLRPAHRRRAFPADPQSAAGAEGRDARRRSRRSRATSMRSASAATSSASSASRRSSPPTPPAPAREVAERGDKTRAAIASRLAAEIYGLDILAENIEDEAHNTTRFIVLSREARRARARQRPGASPPSCSGCATCRPRSTRRWAASPPTAST